MSLENKNINAIRVLAVDMIENAKSGHPGIALGAAPILYALYSRHLNVVPTDDKNIFRDRFVMSAGHGSSVYYATLHAFGYKISMDDLKKFRVLGSLTPGHPEYNHTPGVDATTGPLGQGVATAVGMAIAQKMMASRFNKADLTMFDNYTYALVGEGCLMEGVSYEALSLAGTLQLNKLIVLYDCNKITLDGNLDNVMGMSVADYMTSLGFNVLTVKDGNDIDEISAAITTAKKSTDKPSFIIVNTHIGFGSPLQDSHKAHGSILGAENVAILRQNLGINTEPFDLGKDVNRDLVFLRKRFATCEKTFKERLKVFAKAYPGDYKLLKSYMSGEFDLSVINQITSEKPLSGREYGNLVLNKIAENNSNIICASADLFSSTKANINGNGFVNENWANRNLKVGIREFAMGTISNGIALYGGLTPVQSTFMVFSDYLKNALRLSAMMNLKVISAFTHDSIAVGEDGATHQCCEQLAGLRSIPNCAVFRPANLSETIAAYATALTANGPTVLALSRQTLKEFPSSVHDAMKGGYIVARESRAALDGIIIATGSEVSIALDVKSNLQKMGYNIRVVSMPCVEKFEEQSDKYKNDILPRELKSIFSIEAGNTDMWYKYTGRYGKCFGVDTFGDSGTPQDMYNKFGLTAENITKEIVKVIKENK